MILFELDSLQQVVEPIIQLDSFQIIFPDTIIAKVEMLDNSIYEFSWIRIIEQGLVILLALIAGLVALIQVKSNVITQARVK